MECREYRIHILLGVGCVRDGKQNCLEFDFDVDGNDKKERNLVWKNMRKLFFACSSKTSFFFLGSFFTFAHWTVTVLSGLV